jgi:hypothetical protein
MELNILNFNSNNLDISFFTSIAFKQTVAAKTPVSAGVAYLIVVQGFCGNF